jgi:hypothetical protein
MTSSLFMKKSKYLLASGAGILLLGLAGLMALTNPSQEAYDEFAVQRLSEVLKSEGCQKLPFGLTKQCPTWINDNQAEIKEFVAQNTQRQNFIFFSFYTTDLSVQSILPSLPFLPTLPSYHFETIGAFQNFYVYQAKVR